MAIALLRGVLSCQCSAARAAQASTSAGWLRRVIGASRLICPPARVLFIVSGKGAYFGLFGEPYQFIPSASEIEKLIELVADRLQAVIVACQQARQGGGDEVPFGVQRAEAFVVGRLRRIAWRGRRRGW